MQLFSADAIVFKKIFDPENMKKNAKQSFLSFL